MDAPYNPIDCDFHDQLELRAKLETVCDIVFLVDDGIQIRTRDIIRDLQTEGGEEFALLGDGTRVRLDHLVAVDGKIYG